MKLDKYRKATKTKIFWSTTWWWVHENIIFQNLKSHIPLNGVPLGGSSVNNMGFSVTDLTLICNFLSRKSASGCLSQILEGFPCISPAMTWTDKLEMDHLPCLKGGISCKICRHQPLPHLLLPMHPHSLLLEPLTSLHPTVPHLTRLETRQKILPELLHLFPQKLPLAHRHRCLHAIHLKIPQFRAEEEDLHYLFL